LEEKKVKSSNDNGGMSMLAQVLKAAKEQKSREAAALKV